MKIDWLVTNMTAVGSPGRGERAIWGGGVILIGRFLANSGRICGRGETLWCENPSLELSQLYLGSFDENRVVGNQCNSYRYPLEERNVQSRV